MSKKYELKMIVKEQAAYIKVKRIEAEKLKLDGNGWQAHQIHLSLKSFSDENRHYHIAYSELRGKTRDQIEKPREGNEPNEGMINRIKTMYSEASDEKTLCVG